MRVASKPSLLDVKLGDMLSGGLLRAGVSAAICDADLRYVWASGPIFGELTSDPAGASDAELLPAELAPSVSDLKRQVLATGLGTRQVIEIGPAQTSRFVEVSVEPLGGATPGLVMVAVDVSRQQALDAELRRTEERFQRLTASTLEGVAIHDGQQILECNDAMARMFGYSVPEMIGLLPASLVAPEAREAALDRNRHRDEVPYESIGIRKDGSKFPVEFVGRQLDLEGTMLRVGIARDLTTEKLAQSTLREREARLRSILETVPSAMIVINEHGTIETFSRSAEKLFGYFASEVLGQNVKVLMPEPYRGEHDAYLERYDRTNERHIIGIGRVVSALHKDGTVFPVELSVGEVKLGTAKLFTGFLRDLTATQRIEHELRQAQKMEAVGQLTGGLAHDFNNLLTVILGNLEMLEARLSDPDQLDLLNEARETAEHGAQLTSRLLAFGRRQSLQPAMTDISALLHDLTPLLRRTLGETIEVSTLLRGGPYQVLVDKSQLQNAVLNLAINARDAMVQGGRLIIEVSRKSFEASDVQLYPDVPLGNYLQISVTDTGTGMTREVMERAFEPFFTTKEVGVGSGLGLSMVYGFARQSGGHVRIYSELGHGTTVRLYLPRPLDEGELKLPLLDALAPEQRGDGETILVVEDDPRVRRTTAARVKDLGYRVLEAENGQAALAIIKSEPVDLLFTDIVMPGRMNGFELAAKARDVIPGLRVLFTSGYAEPEIIRQSQVSAQEWLRKPYTRLELARSLYTALVSGPVS